MKKANISARLLTVVLAVVMLLGILPAGVLAADDTAETITAYVTVFNAGEFAMTNTGVAMYQMPVTVTDLDGDGQFTLDEALQAAHETYNTADGYETVTTTYGISVCKLWGVETYSVSFYRNDVFTNAVTLEYLSDGDKVTAYTYADTTAWSDRYSFFTDASEYCTLGTSVTLTLNCWCYDSTWDLVQAPVENAIVGVYDLDTGVYTALEDGTLTTGADGTVTITFPEAGTYYVTAKAASGDAPLVPAVCTVIVAKEAYWPNFRGNDYNMAITDTATPTSADTTVLKWAAKLGTGWAAAPSVQIIADDALIVMSGTVLYKLDLQTGEILQTGTMSASPSYGYTPPIYAEGLIICPLGGGVLEAFDVNTLESVWVFKDALGGQALTPVTYSDGKVYTGFWNGEAKDANIVCVDIEDGSLVWSKTVTGGSYWAGGVVIGDALIIGTDDGESGYTGDSHLYSLNKETGEVITDLTLTGCGDQRSTVSYSAEIGKIYFTTKNGYIGSAKVDASTGELSDLLTVSHGSAQSTSTPLVYGDKVYYCCGSGVISDSNGAGNFVVADAETLEILYTVPLLGYPQASVLLSTAYLETEGKLYFYSTYNGQPGGLTLIKVDPTVSDASGYELEEIYDAAGYEQYCIASPICGPDGTIYYKNDSGNVLAVCSNYAYMTGLTGDIGAQTGEFSASALEIEWVVPIGTEVVNLTPSLSEGSTCTINGLAVSTAPVTLTDGTATATVVVTNGSDTRTYTITIREISDDASLSGLKVNQSNSYTGSALTLTPELTDGTYYYGVYTATRNWVNVWPDATDANATVQVYAIENIKAGQYDEETLEIGVTAVSSGHNRYAIYSADESQPWAIRIVVTAENGDTQEYVLVMSYASAQSEAEALLAEIQEADAAAAAAANQAAADAVMEAIDAIGTVTLDSKEAIDAAREAYEALTEEQKELVTNLDTLIAAEEAYAALAADQAAADAVMEAIDAIGTVT
ncbi:MAG: PQQ-binding-like beta-propeller repeat protein, partial [Firmicutes bacterium]|nr:PQQ-binding-like beta-propeller repeat protein [Bacillota bacterium]